MVQIRTMILPVVACFTLGAATALHAQERMRAGMWENTMTAARQTATPRNACFSAEKAAVANGSPAMVRAEIEKTIAKGGACTLQDFKLGGNTMTWTMVCGAHTQRNDTTFHGGDSFETTLTSIEGGVTKVSQIKGRRTGDCKPGEE